MAILVNRAQLALGTEMGLELGAGSQNVSRFPSDPVPTRDSDPVSLPQGRATRPTAWEG